MSKRKVLTKVVKALRKSKNKKTHKASIAKRKKKLQNERKDASWKEFDGIEAEMENQAKDGFATQLTGGDIRQDKTAARMIKAARKVMRKVKAKLKKNTTRKKK